MEFNAKNQYEPDQIPFLLETQEFRRMAQDPSTSIQDLSAKANEITSKYVRTDGAGVNIGTGLSKQMLASADKLSKMASGQLPEPSVEDRSIMMKMGEDEMVKLLKTNGLNRFVQTQPFQEIRQQHNEVEAEQVAKAENRIKELQAQGEKLASSKWERFKAFFKGGADKMQKDMLAEIDKNQQFVMMKTDPERFEKLQRGQQQMIDKLQRQQDKLAPKVEQYDVVKDAVIKKALSGNGMVSSKEDMSKIDELAAKAPSVEAAKNMSDRLGQQKQEVQASKKVGEMLKGQLGSRSQGQSQQRSVGVSR